MNEITVFENPEFGQMRTMTIDEEPWFVAVDICQALEIGNPSQAITRLDDDERMTTLISNESAASGKSLMAFVNEPGLYSLVLGSRKPEAKAFKRWITHDVVPSIRKHGMYATDDLLNDPDLAIKAFTALKEERERRKALEAQNAEMKPKALFADAVSTSHTSILVGELAKILKGNGVEFGRDRLFEWLRQNVYLIKGGSDRNMPTQKSMELGLMEIKESTSVNPDGSVRINKTTKITGKGQQYFINKFLAGKADGQE